MTSFVATASFLITILYTTFCSGTQLNLSQNNYMMGSSNNFFANNLFFNIVEKRSKQNIVVSTASIHAGLAFIYLGSEGVTANETRTALDLPQESKTIFASRYGDFLKSTFRKTNADDDAPQLKMANRLYVSNNIKIKQSFNEIAQKNFGFETENVDFSLAEAVVEEINIWVEQQTNNKIKKFLQTDAVDSQTITVLVNVIYLKALWKRPFSASSTQKADFYISDNEKVKVDFMHTDDEFGYVELDDLNSKALEMPYKNSDLSMMIILPNKDSDLKKLGKKLKTIDFNNIASRMVEQDIKVYMPKFRIEFDIDLIEPLKQLGITTMFEEKANLTGIFDSDIPQRITSFKHKAYLDCNEAGSEAAAATYFKASFMSFNMYKKTFRADRPFAFVIRSKTAILFAGQVASFA